MFNGNQGNPFSATKERGGGGIVRILLTNLLKHHLKKVQGKLTITFICNIYVDLYQRNNFDGSSLWTIVALGRPVPNCP